MRKAERMGAVVRGRYDPDDLLLSLNVDVFVELDDGRRVRSPQVNRWLGRHSLLAHPAGEPAPEPTAPTEDEVLELARELLEEERLYERWDGLLLPVLRARARPRIRRLSRRSLAIELSPGLRQSLAGR